MSTYPRSEQQDAWALEWLGEDVLTYLADGDIAARSTALRASFDVALRPDGTTLVRPRIWPAEVSS